MNKNKAFDHAIKESVARHDVIVVFEKGLGDYGVTTEIGYMGDDELVIAKFYNGTREE